MYWPDIRSFIFNIRILYLTCKVVMLYINYVWETLVTISNKRQISKKSGHFLYFLPKHFHKISEQTFIICKRMLETVISFSIIINADFYLSVIFQENVTLFDFCCNCKELPSQFIYCLKISK